MFTWLLLLVVSYTIVLAEGRTKESDACYREVKALYDESNKMCFSDKCKEERVQKKRELMDNMQKGCGSKYIEPQTECTNGYRDYNIGSFDDPVEIPCSEQAFVVVTKEEEERNTQIFRKLKKLYNDYSAMCFNWLSKVDCGKKKWERGQLLAKAIQEATEQHILQDNCGKGGKVGLGWYSFDQGMGEAEMPCKPMPDGTKYGDPGTIQQ